MFAGVVLIAPAIAIDRATATPFKVKVWSSRFLDVIYSFSVL